MESCRRAHDCLQSFAVTPHSRRDTPTASMLDPSSRVYRLHEFWATAQLIEAVSHEVKSRSAKKVLEVNLVIGKMTFLRADQMKFAYDVLTKNTALEGSKLNIEESDPDIECEKCGYRGPIDVEEDPAYHFSIPSLSCPKCGAAAKNLGGRECTIRSVVIQK